MPPSRARLVRNRRSPPRAGVLHLKTLPNAPGQIYSVLKMESPFTWVSLAETRGEKPNIFCRNKSIVLITSEMGALPCSHWTAEWYSRSAPEGFPPSEIWQVCQREWCRVELKIDQ